MNKGVAEVRETDGRPLLPTWGGTGWPQSAELAQRLFLLRLQASEALREGRGHLKKVLSEDFGLGTTGVELLADYFQEQDCVSEIPSLDLLLIEIVRHSGSHHYYLHTPLNRQANDAIARVLVRRLGELHGITAQPIIADLGICLVVDGDPLAADEALPDRFRALLEPSGFATDLDQSIANSAIYQQKFQQVATTGLMILRNPLNGVRKVGGRSWGENHLFNQISSHDPDFFLLRQAKQEIMESFCDVARATGYVECLGRMSIRCRWLRNPSPFARHWTQSDWGETEPLETQGDVLKRLHALLFDNQGGRSHAV